MKDCIVCSKPIKESKLEAHVNACLSEQIGIETMKKQTIICFSW
jgi:hypothetical protein